MTEFRLDPTQAVIADFSDTALLGLAPPGSGKTASITQRAANLLESGVDASRLLMLTFSRQAADEMSERVHAKSGELPVCATFHSFGLLLIRQDAEQLGRKNNPRGGSGPRVISSFDSQRLFGSICEQNGIRSYKDHAFYLTMYKWCRSERKLSIPQQLSDLIDEYFRKQPKIDDDKDLATVINHAVSIFKSYEVAKRDENVVDFDDCISLPIKALLANPSYALEVSHRYDHIIIDEGQDMDANQYLFVKLICKHNNIVIIADDDQSIYAFRGSDPKLLDRFVTEYGATTITLTKNYRSSPAIVDIAKRLINQNDFRHPKNFISMQQGDHEPPKQFLSENHDKHISILLANIANDLRSGIAPKDIAILYRNNFFMQYLKDALVKNGMPCRVLGGIQKSASPEMHAYLCVVRLSIDANDYAAFRFIGGLADMPKPDLQRAIAYCKKSKNEEVSVWEALTRLRNKRATSFRDTCTSLISRFNEVYPSEGFDFLINDLTFSQWLRKALGSGSGTAVRQANRAIISESKKVINEYIEKCISFSMTDIQIYSALRDQQFLEGDMDFGDPEAITLGTIHKSKGMEWRSVHIVGFTEGICPSFTTTRGLTASDLRNERRLAYVALTRARERLCVYHSDEIRSGGQTRSNLSPSRFFKDISSDY